MELKSRISAIVLLFLLALATPCFSRDVSAKLSYVDASNVDSGIYDIDYRGPQTHSYIPPPNRSGPKHHIHPGGFKGKRIHE